MEKTLEQGLQPETQPGTEKPDTQGKPPAEGAKPLFADIIKDKAYQADFDRTVSKAIETAKAKWEQDAQERIKTERTQAEELARMTAEQRAEHERKTREEALLKREADIARRELKAEAMVTLGAKGLPLTLADTLVYTDAEACAHSIDVVEKSFRDAVQEAVEARLKGTSQAPGGGKPAKKDWKSMTLTERGALYNENKEQAIALAREAGEYLS